MISFVTLFTVFTGFSKNSVYDEYVWGILTREGFEDSFFEHFKEACVEKTVEERESRLLGRFNLIDC